MLEKYDTEYFEDYLRQNNIICKLIDLPTKIRGLTVKKVENYFVILNAKFDIQTQRKSLIHELNHIDLGHLEVQDIALHYPELEKEVLNIIK